MAIEGFEDFTYELTKYEKEELLPIVIKGLEAKVGEAKAITSKQAIDKLKGGGLKIPGARWRKIISYIRCNGLIENLVSFGKGYYIATTEEERVRYMKSLRQRIQKITLIYDSMEFQHNKSLKNVGNN